MKVYNIIQDCIFTLVSRIDCKYYALVYPMQHYNSLTTRYHKTQELSKTIIKNTLEKIQKTTVDLNIPENNIVLLELSTILIYREMYYLSSRFQLTSMQQMLQDAISSPRQLIPNTICLV